MKNIVNIHRQVQVAVDPQDRPAVYAFPVSCFSLPNEIGC